MSVKVRLSMVGKKHQRLFRIVAQDTKSKRDGKFLEIIGNVTPGSEKPKVKVDKVKLQFWLSKGAKLTPAVSKLIGEI